MKASILSAAGLVAAQNETVQVFHLFERKFTGLADKDAADFEGEVRFIFMTFNPKEATNPEAAIGENIFEMSTVSVTGWGEYQPCNAPGCTGHFTCPADGGYCCTSGGGWNRTNQTIANNTESTLPGRKIASGGGRRRRKITTTMPAAPTTTAVPTHQGYWYSFPKESEGSTWTEVSIDRRINSSCLAEAWRADAGGCEECDDLASQCVGDCIQAALINGSDYSALRATWDRVWGDKTICPDVPFPDGTLPGSSIVV